MTAVSALARGSAVVVTYAAAWGWTELLRGVSLPGPRISDALALYEAARQDSVAAPVVLLTWGLSIAAIAALVGARSTVALATLVILLPAVTTCLQAFQLELVRQAALGLDLSGALGTPLPWLTAALAAADAVPLGLLRARRGRT